MEAGFSPCGQGLFMLSIHLLFVPLCSPATEEVDTCSADTVHYHGINNTTTFWLDDVDCQGDENNLLECDHSPIGEHDCILREAAVVKCDTSKLIATHFASMKWNITPSLTLTYILEVAPNIPIVVSVTPKSMGPISFCILILHLLIYQHSYPQLC